MRFPRLTIKSAMMLAMIMAALVLPWDKIHWAGAQTIPLLNFVGKVTNLDGSEIADGSYDIGFRLFSSPSGGSALWSETLSTSTRFYAASTGVANTATGTVISYSGASGTSTLRAGQYLSAYGASEAALIVDFDTTANEITLASSSYSFSSGEAITNRPFIEGGVLNENLGTVSSLSGIDFSQTLYLEITFNNETMAPRKILTTAPAAFDAIRLGGKTESEFAALDEDEIISGEWNFNNIVSIATTSDTSALTVVQNGSGNIVEFKAGATTSFAVLSDGRVRIGDYYFPTTYGSPGYVLKTDLNGDLYWDEDRVGGYGSSGQDMLWATNTAETLIHPIDTADVVVIGNIATTTLENQIFEVQGQSLFDMVNISNQQELRFYDADSSDYLAIRATTTMGGNVTLTLPGSSGNAGEFLMTDGSGNLYWGTAPSAVVYANAGTAGQLAYYETDGLTVSGTSSIYISELGYVGIGTSSPASLLTVGDTAGSQFLVNNSGQVVGGVWQGQAIAAGQGGTGLAAVAEGWSLFGDSAASLQATSTLYLSAAGRIGFGTTAPASLLDVAGTARFRGSADTIGLYVSDAGYAGVGTTTPDTLFHVDGTGTFGEICFGSDCISNWGTAGPIDGSGTAGQIAVWSDANTLSASSTIRVAYGGTGVSSWNAGDILYAQDTDTISAIARGANNTVLAINSGGSYAWIGTTTWTHARATLSTTSHDYLDLTGQEIILNQIDIGDDTNLGVSATGIELSGDDIILSANYIIPLSASTTEWNEFYTDPSSRITAGNYISWSGNELNVVDNWWDDLSDMTLLDGYIYAGYGGAPSGTSTIFIDTAMNYVGIGTTTPDTELHVDGAGTFGELCFNGSCIDSWSSTGLQESGSTAGEPAVWLNGNTLTSTSSINVAYGGTGRKTLTDGALLLGAGSEPLVTLDVTTAGAIVVGDGSGAPTVLNAFTAADGVLKVAYGGIGTSSAWWTGLAFVSNGSWAPTSTLQIAYGGTGADNASSARANLGVKGIYEYGINSTATSGWVWISDSSGRGRWVATSSLGLAAAGGGLSASVFVGTTSQSYDGHFASSSYEGYAAANYLCDYEYPGSHFCRTYDLLVTVERQDVSGWGGEGWVAEGPPGFTSDSNDCNGWTDNDSAKYGAWWEFTPSGGMGWLIYCNFSKPISCCSR